MFKFRKRFPYYFRESGHGSVKAKLGQKLNRQGEPELIIELQFRQDDWRWKKIGSFRYLDVPELRQVLLDVDNYIRSLVTYQSQRRT